MTDAALSTRRQTVAELVVTDRTFDDVTVLETGDVWRMGQMIGVERSRRDPTSDEPKCERTFHGALFTRSASPYTNVGEAEL